MPTINLITILLNGHFVTEEDVIAARQAAKKHGSKTIDELIAVNAVTPHIVGEAIAENLGVRFADLTYHPPSPELVRQIPEKFSKSWRVIFFENNNNTVTVASDNPTKPGLEKALSSLFPKQKIIIAYGLSPEIDLAFNHYHTPLADNLAKLFSAASINVPDVINEIFEAALNSRASDIHLEPRNTDVMVRFRVDGVLQEAANLPTTHYATIINRLKVLSRLRIDEHLDTQDGSLHYQTRNDGVVDMRLSFVPTVTGETAVIRLLSRYVGDLTLSDLGLGSELEAKLLAISHKPFGMILSTGPTGSGKTTTLYALIKLLNQPGVNITTIEDPVEYRVDGTNQIQVNDQTNLTFAKGLRAIVRQDPNIILVGEIRDHETAEIATNAALTGHLLLSTFHANDAPTAIPRLIDMGIEPFLLASTLQIIVAQRLARKICENCRTSETISIKSLLPRLPTAAKYFRGKTITHYRGKGCSSCANTGYRGRVGLFEILLITPAIQESILTRPSSKDIWTIARAEGMRSMFEDGIQKVGAGIITINELLRVASPSPYAK